MKWFKHFTDAHNGKSMRALSRKLGLEGVARYWILVEMCAAKLDKKTTEEFTDEHCHFDFDWSYMRDTLQTHQRSRLLMFLSCVADAGLMSFTSVDDVVTIYMPKLLECLDRDTSRARPRRGNGAPKIKNKEIDKEIDKDIKSSSEVDSQPSLALVPVLKKKSNPEINRPAWDSYRAAYIRRWGHEPIRDQKNNTAMATIVRRIGAELAPEVLNFYVSHNDGFYIKSTHALGLALRDIETLRTQYLNGRSITSRDIRNIEKQTNTQSLLESLRNGEI